MEKIIRFTLNGQEKNLTLDRERMLLWVLRTDYDLTGTKYGCGEGFCGACTVLINNEAVRSCQYAAEDLDGKEVLTIEGLSKNGKLHFTPEAVMNAIYYFIQHSLLGTDIASFKSIWASWPNK